MRPSRAQYVIRWTAVLLCALPVMAVARPLVHSSKPVTTDLYTANHPRLLYTLDEVPELYARARQGGNAADAYNFIRGQFYQVYKYVSVDSLVDDDYGQEEVANMGLVVRLEKTREWEAEVLGRQVVNYIAENWGPDGDAFGSALRLRSLALGYDMFFEFATFPERNAIRDEIQEYVEAMLYSQNFEVWRYRPYLSNKSAMIAAAMGLGAIVLDGEVAPVLVSAALADADDRVARWIEYHLDPDGACVEGALYGSWSMRNLIYYFHARERYDGFRYADDPRIRNMETWFAYELDPAGGGKVNNIQDCTSWDHPLPRHTTYFDWAQSMWESQLAGYLWNHIAGQYGYDHGDRADKVGTVLWNRDYGGVNPTNVLPKSKIWKQRGLYYYRSGWPDGATSEDVVFSFYSGEFQGGHAQEDQNQFSLAAYGGKFAIDHGPGSFAKQSEAHNIVFVDGAGQHNAGSAIGTDGRITSYVIGEFADFLMGDATSAYSTYSPLNSPDVPYLGADWSWGYKGANPVEHAHRRVLVVHDPARSPYFIILDDVDKDGSNHLYEWRVHTLTGNAVDVSQNPVRLTSPAGSNLDVHALNPSFDSMTKAIAPYDNLTEDPDSDVLTFTVNAVNPHFAFLLMPVGNGMVVPTVTRTETSFGSATVVDWQDGGFDVFIHNTSGGMASVGPGGGFWPTDPPGEGAAQQPGLVTDARYLVVQFDGNSVEQYVAVDASLLAYDGLTHVEFFNGTASIVRGRERITIDRFDADFRIYAPGITDVSSDDEPIYVVEDNDGYLQRSPATAVEGAPIASAVRVRAFPNPFNPTTRVLLELAEAADISAEIYDVRGSLVRRVWQGRAEAGPTSFVWDGRDAHGRRVASGVYLLKVTSGTGVTTLKLTLLK